MTESRPNRLAKETSTYLKGASHQPVDWYPWGEEAFRRAKELDRPILLDIGATWCHWCHVIDRESVGCSSRWPNTTGRTVRTRCGRQMPSTKPSRRAGNPSWKKASRTRRC